MFENSDFILLDNTDIETLFWDTDSFSVFLFLFFAVKGFILLFFFFLLFAVVFTGSSSSLNLGLSLIFLVFYKLNKLK